MSVEARSHIELQLPDGTRRPLDDGMLSIGRSRENAVCLRDRAVSRHHARISGTGAVEVLDLGSRHGTFVDGRRLGGPVLLHEGSRVRIGDQDLVVVRAGSTVHVAALAPELVDRARPRLVNGYALKRVGDDPARPWVIADRRTGEFLGMSDRDRELLALIDGSRDIAELVRDAESAQGSGTPARLTRMLGALSAHGFLTTEPGDGALSGWRRLLRPRIREAPWAPGAFLWLYRHGGRVLVSHRALVLLGAVAAVGPFVFVSLVVLRYDTVFVVAGHIGLGGVVFVLGRGLLVAVHESAHGLAMEAIGRPVRRAGLKLVLVFPYVFVDTSSAWFEPRRRRIAVSAAGPAADLACGAIASIACLVLPATVAREVVFQLAFGAYVGACLNLNPLLDRDGYHILVDVLREPSLRRRAAASLRGASEPSASVRWYGVAGIGWSLVMVAAVLGLGRAYVERIQASLPDSLDWVPWAGLVLCVAALLAPLVMLLVPAVKRRSHRDAVSGGTNAT